MVAPLALTPALGGIGKPEASSGAESSVGGAFGGVLALAEQAMQSQQAAQSLSMAAANGESVPMHQVVQAISQAELTLQTLVTVRDKAVEAYQQIQQMPI